MFWRMPRTMDRLSSDLSDMRVPRKLDEKPSVDGLDVDIGEGRTEVDMEVFVGGDTTKGKMDL
jgi:hypothetical protein